MNDYSIIMDRVCKTYSNNPKPAVDELSFSVRKGSFFAILGPNGAGKSTTLQILSHLVRPDRGVIKIQGWDYFTQAFEAKSSIGIVPQEFNFNIFDTPSEILYNQGGYFGFSRKSLHSRLEFLLEMCDLTPYAHQSARILSGGMKRRLMIARALIHNPPILILDEPTAGVDPQIRQSVWEFLRKLNQQGTTIILTSHYFEEVEDLCDEIAMIQNGRLLLQLPTREFLQRLPHQKLQIELQHPLTSEQIAILVEQSPKITAFSDQILIYDLAQGEPLGPVIALLDRAQCSVLNIAPKKARLEQLFMSMLKSEKNL